MDGAHPGIQVQFVLVGLHLGIPAVFGYCNYSPFLTKLGMFQCGVMVVLFTNFYVRTYVRKPKALSKEKDGL